MSASAANSAAAPEPSRGRRASATGPLAGAACAGLLFAVPAVVLVATLLLYPIGQTVYYSFTNWDGFTAQWIGLAAYSRLFSNPEFVRCSRTTGSCARDPDRDRASRSASRS